jgi:hypothetical protein
MDAFDTSIVFSKSSRSSATVTEASIHVFKEEICRQDTRDKEGIQERKHNNTRLAALRKTYPNFAEGYRSDSTLGTLKENLGLAQSASLKRVQEELKKRTDG